MVQVYGAHLLRQAREDLDATADAAAPHRPALWAGAFVPACLSWTAMNAISDLDEAKNSLRRSATARRRDAAAGDDGAAGRTLAEIKTKDSPP